VDVVGEEDIELDGILTRYKALVIPDAAVRRSVQAKIKEWAQGGGQVLLGSGACAFDEFEEPCDTLSSMKESVVLVPCKQNDPKFPETVAAFARRSGATQQWSSDSTGLWAFSTMGENRQVVFVIKPVGADRPDVTLRIPCTAKPKEVVSASSGALPFDFAGGIVTVRLNLPPCPGLPDIAADPATEIIVFRN
jgi:hypothetical protein